MKTFAAALALLIVVVLGWMAQGADPSAPPAPPAPPAALNLRRTTTVDVVERIKGAVVYISSRKIVAQRIVDPFFQQFDMGTQLVPVGSLGSGFVIHPDGYIVTNNHAIDRARQIKVTLLDGRAFDAELISGDTESDLAILRIHADKPLPAVELGDSSDLLIGEPVIAVGNPLGFSNSVSTGIVSAIHRDLTVPNDRVKLGDLIQTDAAINQGNSGGPLLNAYGQVIGINTAIRSDAQNIGFAIQVNRLRELIPQLMNPAVVTKLDVPIAMKERRKLSPPANVQTTILREDGDVPVISIAGVKPANIVDAYAILLKQKADKAFEVELQGQAAMKILPKPVPLPDALIQAKSRLGITVVQVTPMVAEQYRLVTEDGLYVSEVVQNSVAARAGVQPGDVILQFGQFPVRTVDDLGYLLAALPKSGIVPVRVLRGVNAGFVRMQL